MIQADINQVFSVINTECITEQSSFVIDVNNQNSIEFKSIVDKEQESIIDNTELVS